MITVIEYQNNPSWWDEYIFNNKSATIYHKIGWKNVIERTFKHKSHFLIAEENGKIRGILPLVLMKNRVFGSYLISLPFVDSSGLIADTQEIASILCNKAIELARNNKIDFLEMRNFVNIDHQNLITKSHKVNFILPIDSGSDFLWKKVFHENIRNKIRKAIKNNLYVESGNNGKCITAFYDVFSQNMKSLGTPVFPKKFFINIVKEFPQNVQIFLVYHRGKVIGGKIVLFYGDTVYFIFHSSMRTYAKLAPNNLLYWKAIEYACQNNYKYCNLGRSTKDSGPYYFKKQWGGEERQLYWQYYLNKGEKIPNLTPSNPRFSCAIGIWKRLPLWLTRLIGPMISRNIP